MYILETICERQALDPIWNVVGFIVNAIMIGVPILLIVLGMIDLGKAVIASKEDEVKKATKAFTKRFLYAVGVFAVVWIVTVVLSTVSGLGITSDDQGNTYNEADWKLCWCKIRKGSDQCK